MRGRHLIFPLFIFLFTLLPMGGTAHGASIKERMIARHPTIEALKDRCIVGENNKGFLEYRSGNHEQQAVVQAENNDRSQVYAFIGKKEGVSAALVGQRRAKMLAARGKHGQCFQDSNGTWHKK